MTTIPDVQLNNGVSVPSLGFGVFQLSAEEVQQAVEHALEVGYRHIDTARAYNNEEGVGAAIKASGLPRDEVFVTSKLRNGDQGHDSALRAYADSCERLGLDALDLYLVHWPYPSAGLYVESWRALERLYADGAVRAVGVSNFLPEHLDALEREGDLTPAVNQIELHPTYQQRDLAEDTRRRGIAVEAYSPLGQAADLEASAVTALAEAHEVSAAQVILRWHLQHGNIVIPKSATPARIASNFAVTGFELSAAEMAEVDALEAGNRVGGDPATFALTQIR